GQALIAGARLARMAGRGHEPPGARAGRRNDRVTIEERPDGPVALAGSRPAARLRLRHQDHGAHNHGRGQKGAERDRFGRQKPAGEPGDDRIHERVRGDEGRGRRPEEPDVNREAEERAEHHEIDERRPRARRDMRGREAGPFADRRGERKEKGSAGEHLERGCLKRRPGRCEAAREKRPQCPGERGKEDHGGSEEVDAFPAQPRGAEKERDAQEAKGDSEKSAAPGHVPLGGQRLQKDDEKGFGRDEKRREAGRDALLGPDHSAIPAEEQQGAAREGRHEVAGCDAGRPHRLRGGEEDGAGEGVAEARHEERRDRLESESDREGRGAPDDVEDEKAEDDAALHGATIASHAARDIFRAASWTFFRPSSFAPKSFARRTSTYSRPSGRRTIAASCSTDEIEPVLCATMAPDCGCRPAGISSLNVWPARISHAFDFAAAESFGDLTAASMTAAIPAASVSLLTPLSNAFESSTQRLTFTVGAPSASVNACTLSGPTSERTRFVARLEERTIISVTRNSSVAFPPSFFTVGASVSSRPIENGEPSTRLLNSFFTSTSSERLRMPASARRKTSRRTGVFIVEAACMETEGFLERVLPLARSLKKMPKRAPLLSAIASRARCRSRTFVSVNSGPLFSFEEIFNLRAYRKRGLRNGLSN